MKDLANGFKDKHDIKFEGKIFMIINFFLEKRKILRENRLLVMRDLANGFIDNHDIKFEG